MACNVRDSQFMAIAAGDFWSYGFFPIFEELLSATSMWHSQRF